MAPYPFLLQSYSHYFFIEATSLLIFEPGPSYSEEENDESKFIDKIYVRFGNYTM